MIEIVNVAKEKKFHLGKRIIDCDLSSKQLQVDFWVSFAKFYKSHFRVTEQSKLILNRVD